MNWKASYENQKMTFKYIIGILVTILKKTQETSTNIKLENFNIEHILTESTNPSHKSEPILTDV